MSNAGQRLIRSAQQALSYARGEAGENEGFVAHVPDHVDVRAIRAKLGLSQEGFARRFGFEVRTLRNWEHGRRAPTGATRAFLKVIEREPQAVMRALEPGHEPAPAKRKARAGNAQRLKPRTRRGAA